MTTATLYKNGIPFIRSNLIQIMIDKHWRRVKRGERVRLVINNTEQVVLGHQ